MDTEPVVDDHSAPNAGRLPWACWEHGVLREAAHQGATCSSCQRSLYDLNVIDQFSDIQGYRRSTLGQRMWTARAVAGGFMVLPCTVMFFARLLMGSTRVLAVVGLWTGGTAALAPIVEKVLRRRLPREVQELDEILAAGYYGAARGDGAG